MCFDGKARDIYMNGSINGIKFQRIYPIIVSSVPLERDSFKLALTLGILVIQPIVSRSEYPYPPRGFPPLQAAYARLGPIIRQEKDLTEKEEMVSLRQRIAKLANLTFRALGSWPEKKLHRGTLLYSGYVECVLRADGYLGGMW